MIGRCAIHCDQNMVSTYDSQARLDKRDHPCLHLRFGACNAVQVVAEFHPGEIGFKEC